jgi:hypothetical protein
MEYQIAWELATREWAFLPDEEDRPQLSFDPATLGACRDEKPNKYQLKPEVWIGVGADAYFWTDGVRREPNRVRERGFERSRGLLGYFQAD